jgi:hypothetical protein
MTPDVSVIATSSLGDRSYLASDGRVACPRRTSCSTSG